MLLVTLEYAKGYISRRVFLTDRLAVKFNCSFWTHSGRGILSSEIMSANMFVSGNDKKPQLWPRQIPGPTNFSSELKPLAPSIVLPV